MTDPPRSRFRIPVTSASEKSSYRSLRGSEGGETGVVRDAFSAVEGGSKGMSPLRAEWRSWTAVYLMWDPGERPRDTVAQKIRPAKIPMARLPTSGIILHRTLEHPGSAVKNLASVR